MTNLSLPSSSKVVVTSRPSMLLLTLAIFVLHISKVALPLYCVKKLIVSVLDPWHFGTDPDPRIRTSDKWFRIRIQLFSSVTFKFLCWNSNMNKTIFSLSWIPCIAGSVADPGFGAFLTHGSWNRIRIQDKHPGSATLLAASCLFA